MMKLLSLVVPTCNDAEYLPSCLDSICSQSLNDVELIIVDDGSSDDLFNEEEMAEADSDMS